MTQQAPKSKQHVLRDELERVKNSMAAVLPKHVTPERMIKVVLSATARQPKLLDCTTASIVRSVMQAAELGLEIGGLLGEAYLVPYNVKIKEEGRADRWEKQAQCIPGYRGLIKLARQSGEIATVNSRIVYAGDTFAVDLAQDTISHIPNFEGERTDEAIKLVYCIIRFHEGEGPQFDVMTKLEVDRVRARSKSSGDGPWVTDYAEMARKTVTRRALKYAPISAERMKRAMELDDEDAIVTTGETVHPDAVISDVPQGIAALEEHLKGQSAQEQLDASGPVQEAVAVQANAGAEQAQESTKYPEKAQATEKLPEGPKGPGVVCRVCDRMIPEGEKMDDPKIVDGRVISGRHPTCAHAHKATGAQIAGPSKESGKKSREPGED